MRRDPTVAGPVPLETPSQAIAAELAARRLPLPASTSGELALFVIHLDHLTHANASLADGCRERLRDAVGRRIADTLPRHGDIHWLDTADFGVIASLQGGADQAIRLAHNVAATLGAAFRVDGFELFFTCSIGIALDVPNRPAEHCLREAYDAMLRVRKRGGNDVLCAFTPPAGGGASLLAALPRALARGELAAHLQPHAAVATADIIAYTARLRWHSPALGRVEPKDFLPALATLGLMGEAARGVIAQALPLLKSPVLGTQTELCLTVDSPQLRSPAVIDGLLRAIDGLGTDATRLCLEVPVHAWHVEDRLAIEQLAMLRATGLRLALTDFGNDPGSAFWLHRLQPDQVALDARHLGMPGTPPDASRHLQEAAALARARGAKVCVKGIENRQQLDDVRRWHCDSVEGYLLAQPFPIPWLEQTHAAVQARARELLL